MYLGGNTQLFTGREKVMGIVTPACQFICYENRYLGENIWLDTEKKLWRLSHVLVRLYVMKIGI